MQERFFVEGPLTLGPVTLVGEEAHHMTRVMRQRVGDAVTLFNGDGREYLARVQALARGSVELLVEQVASPVRERATPLCLAAPLPKGERARFLVEKLTELGVSTFVPLICQRSVVVPGEGKRDRLERWVIEASKQCGRNVLMSIEPPIAWQAFVPRMTGVRVFADPRATTPLAELVRTNPFHGPCTLAVGPEGGWTEQEIQWARDAGWHAASLGSRILRIETAAVVLVACLA